MSLQEIFIGKDQASLAGLVGKGGEGKVYAIKGRSGQTAKIYKASLRAKREGKVRAIVDERLAATTNLVAYPAEIITDRQGNFLGFAMQRVSGYCPLHELYNPKSRLRHFSKADYRFLVRAAQNVASAVATVHRTGCVIGDLNHSGLLVAKDATVALIDADSFQFSLKGKTYPCVVGMPDYTPPELQGKNLTSVQRTIAHDNFGLAVALFHLLFMGIHPYAGRYKGPDISIGKAIAQNRFAFSLVRQHETRSSPPHGALLTLNLFPDAIIQSFEKAFGLTSSARPGARDWIQALRRLANDLNHCSNYMTHHYPSSARNCPWCALARNSGFDIFPVVSADPPNNPTDTHRTEEAIREISTFRFPTVANILPSTTTPLGASNTLRKAKADMRRRIVLSLLKMVVGVVIMVGTGAMVVNFEFASPWIALFSIAAIVGLALLGLHIASSSIIEIDPFRRALIEADKQVQHELDALIRNNKLGEIAKVRGDVNTAIAAYKNYDRALERELCALKASREARQRQAYLDRFPIRGANIPGIGRTKTHTLTLYGIETAADLDKSSVLKVPGFGEDLTGKLLAWQREHESQFKYDRLPNAQDLVDERALRDRFANVKSKLESTIYNGLQALRNARACLDTLPTTARSNAVLNCALHSHAQAERDLELLGVSIPGTSVTDPFQPQRRPIPEFPKAPSGATKKPTRQPVPNPPKCPRCGAGMIRRTAKRGKYRGNRFWGCSRYPSCRGIRS